MRIWYISFIEKDKKNFVELIFYAILYILSLIYGLIVEIRNFFYAIGILHSFRSEKKIISIGNISWAGSGKTTLSAYLYGKLFSKFKIAILRRGYGSDEEQLFKERNITVFSSLDRVSLCRQYTLGFDVFILDDGFQYRKLKRDLDIVVMGAREFQKKIRLIPAYFFRERLTSLKRADILVITYKEEMQNPEKIKIDLKSYFPQLKTYFANYRLTRFLDFYNNEVNLNFLQGKKLAALTAIGYPQGFFNKLRETNLKVAQEITYPDHYEFKNEEFKNLQDNLLNDGIEGILITRKDKYHIPKNEMRLNVYIMEIEIAIENEESLLEEVEKKLRLS